jgi:hypothetical protein
VRNAAISRHFERDPIPYALETDWPLGAAGFEPLHFRIGIREDSQPGAAGFEHTHLNCVHARRRRVIAEDIHKHKAIPDFCGSPVCRCHGIKAKDWLPRVKRLAAHRIILA